MPKAKSFSSHLITIPSIPLLFLAAILMMNSSYNFTLKKPSNVGGDDYIGSESTCMDLQNDIVLVEQHKYSGTSRTTSIDDSAADLKIRSRSRSSSSSKSSKVLREFPPPIPLLSTSNNNHLSWALRRYCTSDGRLILKEEKVNNKHCDYFRAHRSNGRLTLHLVHPQLIDEEEDDNYAVANHDHDDHHTTSAVLLMAPQSDDEVPIENRYGAGDGGI